MITANTRLMMLCMLADWREERAEEDSGVLMGKAGSGAQAAAFELEDESGGNMVDVNRV